MKEFIDSSVFMGMHSKNEKERIACKNFFINRISKTVWMSLEQVGKCDDIIWSNFSSKIQESYYPFMDRLHTIMEIKRIPFDKKTVDSLSNINDSGLSQEEKFIVAVVIAQNAKLYTFNKKLLNLEKNFIKAPDSGNEEKFSDLEEAYQESLKLRV
jgi:acetate kinase